MADDPLSTTRPPRSKTSRIVQANPGFESINDAAARTGLHRDTIRDYALKGILDSRRIGLKKTLVRTSDVDRLITDTTKIA